MSPFMFRFVFAALVAVAAASTVIGQVPGTCSPPGTATCDPNGNPIDGPAVPGPVAPDPGAPEVPAAITVHSLTSIVPLGGGLAVKGAEGIAIDPVSGLAYIGLNGTIVSGCEGDPSLTGVTGPGADRGPGRESDEHRRSLRIDRGSRGTNRRGSDLADDRCQPRCRVHDGIRRRRDRDGARSDRRTSASGDHGGWEAAYGRPGPF